MGWVYCDTRFPEVEEDVFVYDEKGYKNVCYYNLKENVWYEHVDYDYDHPVQYDIVKWLDESE